MADDTSQSLSEELAAVLPRDHKFIVHHISTPPSKCDPIYSSPPNKRPERTYRESHFLQISVPIDDEGTAVFVFAIECLVYTTRHLTTIFVSKADSTGYLSSLRLGKEYESPLRAVASRFITFLVKNRSRPGIKLVVDLFARASDQYLYPGSVENAQKHVSDDRQLVKWWCRVLNPIVQSYALRPIHKDLFDQTKESEGHETAAQAYLLVPGEDSITSFLPPLVRLSAMARLRWIHGHPLSSLSRWAGAPPRCLIPHFPDDPKGRYLIELDDELPDANSQSASAIDVSPSKRGNGEWKSVRSLDRFWEMMAFRSECSSGRLVGFIWLVFEPPGEPEEFPQNTQDSQTSMLSTTSTIPSTITTPSLATTPERRAKRQQPKKGYIPALLPRILRAASTDFDSIPTKSPWFTWPSTSRGQLVLPDSAYTKATEVLLRLDFANVNVATQSTRAWIAELAVLANVDTSWGKVVVGKAAPKESKTTQAAGTAEAGTSGSDNGVNVLTGVKRKQPAQGVQTGAETLSVAQASDAPTELMPTVNVLGVRKKPKKVQPVPVTFS